MKKLSRPVIVGAAVAASAAVVAVAVGAGIGSSVGSRAGTASAADSATTTVSAERESAPAATSFPGLAAATTDTPSLSSLAGVDPSAGTVAHAPGPFDDRFLLHGLAFDGSALTGSVVVTSDVSEVLELEVVAGFYDAGGALLGEDFFVLHADEDEHTHSGPPEEEHAFSIPVPQALAGRAVSAAVGVPVLVNE